MPQLSQGTLIGSNIVVDAFGTAVFASGVGFFVVRAVGAEPDQVLSWLSIGGLVGIGFSFVATTLTDVFGPKRILLAVQALQFVVYLGMAIPTSLYLVLALSALGAALARVVSPVRGALPPMYLSKDRLLRFKATVRTWTITSAIAGSAVAAAVGASTATFSSELIPLLNCASFAIAFALTLCLPVHQRTATPRTHKIYRPSLDVITTAALFGVLAALGSAPAYGIAILAAQNPAVPSVSVAVAPVVSFAVALLGQRLSKGRNLGVRARVVRILAISLVLELVATILLFLISRIHLAGPVVLTLVALAAALAELGAFMVALALWDAQYSMGPDSDRASVVGVFTMASSLGMAVAPALSSAFLFGSPQRALLSGGCVVGAACVLGILVSRMTSEQAGASRPVSP
jgi:MFS family permease